MSQKIFVNLPVSDLKASINFYQALGFENNPQYSDDTAACMVWSESIHVMLLTHAKWRTFTNRPIPPSTSSEVLLALLCENREEVDMRAETAAKNGGVADINSKQDLGFMYSRSFMDLDGHVWEGFWMDSAAAEATDP